MARRAWQVLQGRERLQQARLAADQEIDRQMRGTTLLPAVASFLSEQWRQSLVQAWLKDGPGSPRYINAVGLGERIVRLDDEAAHARGQVLAEGLLEIQAPLLECYVACGLDESGGNRLLAELVMELSQPDAQRAQQAWTPLAGQDGASRTVQATSSDGTGSTTSGTLQVGQVVVQDDGSVVAPRWLKLAWQSADTGLHLLVDRLGAKSLTLSLSQVQAMLEDGTLEARALQGPADAILGKMAAAGNGSHDPA